MESLKGVRKFNEQIESGLDLSLDQLVDLEQTNARAIEKFKADIQRELKRGAFTNDLKLTEGELQTVFEEVKSKHSELLADNDIYSFYDFKKLLGLGFDEIDVQPLSEDLQLFGKK